MANTSDFRNGLCIRHNNEPWKIESFQHVKPGKGPAFVRTKIRNLKTGRLLENTFTAGVKIEIIRIENRKYQFLYDDGDDCVLMNNDDFEQISIQRSAIQNNEFLKEGENVEVLFHADEGKPLSVDSIFPKNYLSTSQVDLPMFPAANEKISISSYAYLCINTNKN